MLFRSDAAIEVARDLGGLWSLLRWLRIAPKPVRDWAYDQVARYRYRWFGKKQSCPVPSDEIRSRFLDQEP